MSLNLYSINSINKTSSSWLLWHIHGPHIRLLGSPTGLEILDQIQPWAISHTVNTKSHVCTHYSNPFLKIKTPNLSQSIQYQQYQQIISLIITLAHPWASYLPSWVSHRPWNPWSNPTMHRPSLASTSTPWTIQAGEWDVLPWHFWIVSNRRGFFVLRFLVLRSIRAVWVWVGRSMEWMSVWNVRIKMSRANNK